MEQETNLNPNEGSTGESSSAEVEVSAEGTEEEEEEDECRVCRGPAEEGRQLFAPCKCSGSIGLTHQDCLMSWLEVTRGDGRCELCKTKFRFDPQYAENAPDHLPAHEVFLGLTSRFLAKWLPLAIRIFIAASLWLVVAPLLTACLYHGWMHRPASIIPRMKREIIPSDIVSGAIVAAIIIISFLSLMSFADFLRVHWQEPPRRDEGNDEQAGRNNVANGFGVDDNTNHDYGDIDEAIVWAVEQHQPPSQEEESEQRPQDTKAGLDGTCFRPSDYDNGQENLNRNILETQAVRGRELAMTREARQQDALEATNQEQNNAGEPHLDEGTMGEIAGVLPFEDQGIQDEDASSDDSDGLRPQLNADDDDLLNNRDNDLLGGIDENELVDLFEDNINNHAGEPLLPPPGNEERGERPFDPMDPVLQDDQVDMEINVALDELLGLRGPISTLVRNLLWLLAFNATYLGIFSFVPKTVGSTIYAGLLNTTACDKILKKIPYMHSKDPEKETVLHMLSLLNAASSERNTTFRLPDLATVTLGYFSIAGMIVFMRFGWMLSQKVRQKFSLDEIHTNDEQQQHVRFHDRPRRERDDVVHEFDDRDAMEPVSTGAAVGVALDATVAVVKVGVLLFLKMFLLPLILGLWLDGSTMSLFGHTTSNRVEFAGGDLFSFILLHWVAGITFMLLVTVFLLQLREVAHPNLLARLIRPQEPQPDLLGNLMNETVGTHMKRMFLSLGIYAPLLTMHVTVPVKLFLASGLGDRITFFNLNFWHVVMPQMQIPLELIVFHLSMLALLERYKNSIGGLQHKWMVFMCRKMGLTEYLLPCSIEQFQFVGTKKIFLSRIDDKDVTDATVAKPMVEKSIVRQVDPFWYELAKKEKNIDNIVQTSAIHASIESACKFVDGDTKENGERVLADSMDFIRLPGHTSGDETLLPTKIGRFRLKCVIDNDASNSVIEFWKEVPGKEIPRPPEGWDDLGAGGAFVQRRWAWGKERKSVIEGNVAQSSPFRSSKNENFPIHLILRVACLVVFSWFAITTTILGIVSTPLAVGRSLYFLFRISNEYVHDPLAFCIGGCLFFPMMSLLFKASTCAEGDPTRRFGDWLSRFHIPPKSKLYVLLESLVLWLGVAPMTLGISYEIFAVKTSKWFAREEPVNSLILCWTVGTVVVNTWAFLAYYSVFTRDFWANIGNGILEPPLDGNGMGEVIRNNANEGDREIEGMEEDNVDELYQSWQGKRGRVARFFNVWRSVLSDWEWDAVDHVKLLEDFARPITRQLASALVGSSLSFYFSLYLVPLLARHEEGGVVVPVIGQIDPGLFRKALFRLCMGFHIIVQLGSASRARLEGWFDAAHEAARDDRYLIGEILMNYDEE